MSVYKGCGGAKNDIHAVPDEYDLVDGQVIIPLINDGTGQPAGDVILNLPSHDQTTVSAGDGITVIQNGADYKVVLDQDHVVDYANSPYSPDASGLVSIPIINDVDGLPTGDSLDVVIRPRQKITSQNTNVNMILDSTTSGDFLLGFNQTINIPYDQDVKIDGNWKIKPAELVTDDGSGFEIGTLVKIDGGSQRFLDTKRSLRWLASNPTADNEKSQSFSGAVFLSAGIHTVDVVIRVTPIMLTSDSYVVRWSNLTTTYMEG